MCEWSIVWPWGAAEWGALAGWVQASAVVFLAAQAHKHWLNQKKKEFQIEVTQSAYVAARKVGDALSFLRDPRDGMIDANSEDPERVSVYGDEWRRWTRGKRRRVATAESYLRRIASQQHVWNELYDVQARASALLDAALGEALQLLADKLSLINQTVRNYAWRQDDALDELKADRQTLWILLEEPHDAISEDVDEAIARVKGRMDDLYGARRRNLIHRFLRR
jgi:hypothetical protein